MSDPIAEGIGLSDPIAEGIGLGIKIVGGIIDAIMAAVSRGDPDAVVELTKHAEGADAIRARAELVKLAVAKRAELVLAGNEPAVRSGEAFASEADDIAAGLPDSMIIEKAGMRSIAAKLRAQCPVCQYSPCQCDHMAAVRAFNAYSASTGGKTYDGRPIPKYIDLPRHIKNAWEEAARAAKRAE